MTKKTKFILCIECEHLKKCKAGQARTQGVNSESVIAKDLGCYDHESFISQHRVQLKLF